MPIFHRSSHKRQAPHVAYRQPPPPNAQPPSIDGVANNSQNRLSLLENRIFQLDEQLVRIKKDMQRCRPGSGSYNNYKRRATQILKQKRTLESQAGNASNLTFNLEQVKNASGAIQDAKDSSALLVEQSKALRRELKGVHIDRADDNQDDMEDLLQDADDIAETLGRTYNTAEIDDEELDAELECIDEENIFDNESGSVPSYLQNQSMPSAHGGGPSMPTPTSPTGHYSPTSSQHLQSPIPAQNPRNNQY